MRKRKIIPSMPKERTGKILRADASDNFRGMGVINPPRKNAAKGAFRPKRKPEWLLGIERLKKEGRV